MVSFHKFVLKSSPNFWIAVAWFGFQKMPLEVGAALQEYWDKENVKVRENDKETALRTLSICVFFFDREWEKGWWEGPTLRPLTQWTFIPIWQMTRFYEAPWAPRTSPQSSHSAHQHPQQRFSPLHVLLMWDRAKPCNTKRLGIIHMFAPAKPLAHWERAVFHSPANKLW